MQIQSGRTVPLKINFFPVPKSPIPGRDLLMQKMRGQKSHTWAPLTLLDIGGGVAFVLLG